MSGFVDVLLNMVRPYSVIITVIIVFLLFLIVGYYYGYQTYLTNLMAKTKFSNVANTDMKGKDVTVYFFTVDWCPHCKNAKPEWEKFVAAKDGTTVKGHKIHCRLINCTSDNTQYQTSPQEKATAAEMIERYDVKGYPTVKMEIEGGDTIEYDAKITSDGLIVFLDSVLE